MIRRWLWVIIVTLTASACSFPLEWLADNQNDNTQLIVNIQYEGGFYTEYFNYTPDAGNIRHVVLVMPAPMASQVDSPGWIFTNVEPQVEGGLLISQDRPEYAWALDYLYEAPGGVFSGTFKPGKYVVAAAFLAGPITREDAGASPDAILWPGITGGGASTSYQTVELAAGETAHLTFRMTDADGWACPWLYVYDGAVYQRTTEILRNLRGADSQRVEVTLLPAPSVVDGAILLRVVEEKDEMTILDTLYLLVDGVPVYAGESRLMAADGVVVRLAQGDSIDLRFVVGDVREGASVAVVASGYYLPDSESAP